ncbi:MAG: hypothetical protein BMS9Abin36_1733 [Gammaproteobacteria bacterium]|nr:MAG: hypothetical protein BMS9Abin36_1733 [Gammaproteobacteria bacterium]
MTHNLLTSEEFIFFTTREFALAAEVSVSAASKQLKRLGSKDFIVHVVRGIWANTSHPYFNPLGCVPYLLGNEQGYVSFLTALHRHGMLSQIPHTTQVATTGHSRKLKTPIGVFEFFQLKPEMMTQGIEWSETRVPYRMATPEKALLDVFYIATRKKKRFSSLPELEIESTAFKYRKFNTLLKKTITSRQIANAIMNRAKKLPAFPHAVGGNPVI